MSEADRGKWDGRHARASDPGQVPAWLDRVASLLPPGGRALDVASGRGRIALWLAARGFDVLAVDISAVALEQVRRGARGAGLAIATQPLDLETDPLPPGLFDCIACFHYLQRALFAPMIDRLAPGGVLLAELHTRDNLQRHAHPSARFLVEPGELADRIAPLEPLVLEEGWFEGRALARCLAAKRR